MNLVKKIHQIKYQSKIAVVPTSFICPYYLKNSLFSYERKWNVAVICFTISISMGFTGTMAKVYNINWEVTAARGFSSVIKLTRTQDLVTLF